MQLYEIALHYETPSNPWEVVGADIFMANNKTLSIMDYYSKFLGCKKDGMPFSR